MNRMLALMIGTGLAIVVAGAAYADSFSITRYTSQTSISRPGTGGDIVVTFLNQGVESPQAESEIPGTSLTLLNYTVSTTAPNAPTDNVHFNDTFTLDVVLTDYSYPTNPTYTSRFNGTITGFANRLQDNLVITLTPDSPADMAFEIGNTRFKYANILYNLPPIVNDTQNPGAVSAHISSYVVPEPGSMALLGTALLPAIGLLRRRR